MTKLHRNFKKLEKSITSTKWGKTVVALIKLAEKEVNPAMLAKLMAKFSEVRDSIMTSMDDATAAEADSLAAYNEFMAVSA
jgi:hypothetical protein